VAKTGAQTNRPAQRGMGRGLAALLPQQGEEQDSALRELSVELIAPNPRQPRGEFDEQGLAELAESIRTRGLLQPLVVRPLSSGHYELVAGERRLRAAKICGLDRVAAIVRDTETSERLELALIENMAREDLNSVEEARACATLVEDLGITKEELGRRVGRSRVAVSNLIRLLELPDEALGLIEAGHLSGGHGRALLLCADHAQRRSLARQASSGGWTVRETERRAKQTGQTTQTPPKRAKSNPELDEAATNAQEALASALGRDVRVQVLSKGFRVQFEVQSTDEAMSLAQSLTS
jgi:ParB family transcriptional regulator, chromosome partitioning protein